MVAIGGIYRLDGERVGRRQLDALARALEARGLEGGGHVLEGAIAMAQRASGTTPALHHERQPVAEPRGWMLTWDGRLDNAEDLVHSLRLDRQVPRTDPDVVLAVLKSWGAQGIARLVGDFALAAWDEGSRTAWLARDPFGARPLFFHVGDGVATWTSDLLPLVDLLGFRPEIDDDYVAGFLAAEVDIERSPFVGIHSVPPGHLVKISREGVSRTRFWSPAPRTEIRYKTDAEYEEHFRSVFRESVRCRLRAQSPVWAELSGGFDSSSIVVVADDLLKEGSTSTRVDTVSYVFDQSPMSNELSYLKGVEDQRGRQGHHILESECPILTEPHPDIEAGTPNYLLCYAQRHTRLSEGMRQARASVLLCGHGGDHMLWSQPDASHELADLFVAGRWRDLLERAKPWSRSIRRPYIATIARSVSTAMRSHGGRPLAPIVSESPMLQRCTRDRAHRDGQRRSAAFDDGVRLPSRREQLRLLRRAISISASCYYRDLGGIDVAYPFLDRRVVEFLLAIPIGQIARPECTRSLHRRALGKLLPESVRNRRGKRAFDHAFLSAARRELPRLNALFEDPRTASSRYLRAPAVVDELRRAAQGRATQSFVLMKVVALAFWLRRMGTTPVVT